jgi:hypothetical protein
MRFSYSFFSGRFGWGTGLLLAAFLLAPAASFAGAVVPLSLSGFLPANDDGSTSAVPLGIGGASGINFFGQNFNSVYVNNNGNVTFGQPLGQYTPNGLAEGVDRPIIAPFFADVDTRGAGSGLVTYGNAIYNGQTAFVVDWLNVGYYDEHTDKTNSLQLILINRPDTGAGNFDIEFNYDRIQWETGDASDGSNGLGGTSAAAGYSNGQSGSNNVYYQLAGSLVNGALLDGGPNSLTGHSLNSNVLGRYDFEVRNGAVIVPTTTPEPMSMGLLGLGLVACWAARKRFIRM